VLLPDDLELKISKGLVVQALDVLGAKKERTVVSSVLDTTQITIQRPREEVTR
jgi:hypothetical protein